MGDIIIKWIGDLLGLPLPHFDDPPLFCKYLSNGYLAGEILRKYNIISDDQAISLTKSHSELSRANNMGKLYRWLTDEGLQIDPNIFQDIIDEKPGAGIQFLYQLYLWLESPKDYKLAGFNFSDPTKVRRLSNRADLASFHLADRPDDDENEWFLGMADEKEKLDEKFKKSIEDNPPEAEYDSSDLDLKAEKVVKNMEEIENWKQKNEEEKMEIINEIRKKFEEIPIFTKLKHPCEKLYEDDDEWKDYIKKAEELNAKANKTLKVKRERMKERDFMDLYYAIKKMFGYQPLLKKKKATRKNNKEKEQMDALRELDEYDKRLKLFHDDPNYVVENELCNEDLDFTQVYMDGRGDSYALEKSLIALKCRVNENKKRLKAEKKALKAQRLKAQMDFENQRKNLIYGLTLDISAPERRLVGFILQSTDPSIFTQHRKYVENELVKIGYNMKKHEGKFCNDKGKLTSEESLSLKNQKMENFQIYLKKDDEGNADFINCILDGLVNMADLAGQIRDKIRPPPPLPSCIDQYSGECDGEGDFEMLELNLNSSDLFKTFYEPDPNFPQRAQLNSAGFTNLDVHEEMKLSDRSFEPNSKEWIESGRLPPPSTPKSGVDWMSEEESVASAPVYGSPKAKILKSSVSMK